MLILRIVMTYLGLGVFLMASFLIFYRPRLSKLNPVDLLLAVVVWPYSVYFIVRRAREDAAIEKRLKPYREYLQDLDSDTYNERLRNLFGDVNDPEDE